jgi:hypothetical protein
MSLPERYSVHVWDRSKVEYQDQDRTVIPPAGMVDGEVYVGQEKVTAGNLDPADRHEVTERVVNSDGSLWRPAARPDGGSIPDAVDRIESGIWAPLRRIFRVLRR